MALQEEDADVSMNEHGEEEQERIPSTSLSVQLLNQLLASRRDRYRALRSNDQDDEGISFPQNEANGRGSGKDEDEGLVEKKKAIRTTHMVLRILGLSFVVPLATLSETGLPGELSEKWLAPAYEPSQLTSYA